MTYEVQVQHEGAEYKVIGPDIDGMLKLIQGLQGTEVVPEHELRRDAAEATLKRLKYEWRGGEQWAPPIGPAPAFLDDPHAELRKTWAPGQIWQCRKIGCVGEAAWLTYRKGAEPGWREGMEYRRHPDDVQTVWIDWAGGACPVAPNTKVEVQLRNGGLSRLSVCYLNWAHEGKQGDIVRYRVCE